MNFEFKKNYLYSTTDIQNIMDISYRSASKLIIKMGGSRVAREFFVAGSQILSYFSKVNSV